MNKKVLMGLVLLAIIGTSAVFAQAPTLDKLRFDKVPPSGTTVSYRAGALNNQISGAVVIPDTYNNLPVTGIIGNSFRNCKSITSVTFPNSLPSIGSTAFYGCTGLTSVTIPASVTTIESGAFRDCTNLTSVTFLGTAKVVENNANYSNLSASFDGDLTIKYQGSITNNNRNAGGPGTYTRQAGSDTWTKQGGGFTLNGVWTRSDGVQITISGDGSQTLTIAGNAPSGRFSRNFAER